VAAGIELHYFSVGEKFLALKLNNFAMSDKQPWIKTF